jgi:hypothetical protein
MAIEEAGDGMRQGRGELVRKITGRGRKDHLMGGILQALGRSPSEPQGLQYLSIGLLQDLLDRLVGGASGGTGSPPSDEEKHTEGGP